jgi:hypothetical protein
MSGRVRNLAELIAFAEHADLAGAGCDGNVGVVEGGELGFAQPGVKGERHQGMITHAASLGGAQQPPLLVLVQRPGSGAASASSDPDDIRGAEAEPGVEGVDGDQGEPGRRWRGLPLGQQVPPVVPHGVVAGVLFGQGRDVLIVGAGG